MSSWQKILIGAAVILLSGTLVGYTISKKKIVTRLAPEQASTSRLTETTPQAGAPTSPQSSQSETSPQRSRSQTTTTPNQAASPISEKSSTSQSSGTVSWSYQGGGWQPAGSPPSCPSQPMLRMPVDINLVTSVLYPGQTRGGDYKAHGGFRFDNSKNDDITVRAPIAASIFRGSRYIEEGEVQYILDFIAPCGVFYRYDHLLTLSPKMAKVADQFRQPTVGDSRTTDVSPVSVDQGEVIATAVGTKQVVNVGVDFGVYDLRSKNEASKNPSWAATHSDSELKPYAVCWFDWFPTADASKIRSLPAGDQAMGSKSDFC